MEGRLLVEGRTLLEGSPIVEVRSNGEKEGRPLVEGRPLLMVEEGLLLVLTEPAAQHTKPDPGAPDDAAEWFPVDVVVHEVEVGVEDVGRSAGRGAAP